MPRWPPTPCSRSSPRGGRSLRAVYGVYLISNRQIWAPRHGSAECLGLAYPPADPAAFRDFGDRVVQSERIAALLARGAE